MTVQDVIDAANTSELLNVYQKPEAMKQAAIISWINQGIIEIAKIIPLINREKVYNLTADSIDTGLTYLLPDDCLGILGVYGESGQEVPVNDESDPYSIFTPSFNRILIPYAEEGSAISILYSGKPDKVILPTDNLPINEVFLECILTFISYKAYKSLDSNDSTRVLSAKYKADFNKELAFILDSGLYSPDGIKEQSSFDRGGWR